MTAFASSPPPPLGPSVRAEPLGSLGLVGGGVLSAGSGLVEVGGKRYVVADDELWLGIFPSAGGPGHRHRLFADAELPVEAAERKRRKPDLEALAYLPAGLGIGAGGALLALSSGSTPARDRAALISLDAEGEPGAARTVDASPLYTALRARFAFLNLEGAAVLGDDLRVLQRGNGKGAQCIVLDLELRRVLDALKSCHPIDPLALRGARAVDLGSLPGAARPVPITFTDLSPLGDGRAVFVAAAEDTDDPYDDGVIVGAAVGVLGAEGFVESLHLLDGAAGRAKVEGVHVVRATARHAELRLVTDPDDPGQASAVFRARLPLPVAPRG